MSSLYEIKTTKEEAKVLEALRKKIAEIGGVTLQGNRLTVRWYEGEALVNVHMVIERLTTPTEFNEYKRQYEKMEALYEKYPDLQHELFHVEHGEHMQ